MKIAVLKEKLKNENRVAITPETAKKFVEMGIDVCIEEDAGAGASITNQEYLAVGAKISKIPLEILGDANILLKVQPSNHSKKSNDELDELSFMQPGTLIIGCLSPYNNLQLIKRYAENKITSIAVELIPRITRAQSMDVLSSQSNLAGYRAVIEAANHYDKVFPMMMTAAGTVNPAKVLILGAGVAGLQAIATAKRLGAIVSVFDVRPEAKEQVESLGAHFVEVDANESGAGAGGYAKEMSADYQKKQADLINDNIKKNDIVITTALIPGRAAPILITKEMVNNMKPGSVIVDLAASAGGNCQLTKFDKIVIHNGVKIIGHENYLSSVAFAASRLYANNLFNLVKLILQDNQNEININFNDEILAKSVITFNGEIVNKTIKDMEDAGGK